MATKEKVIVILLVLALVFSFVSLTLHFVSPSQKASNSVSGSGSIPSGQVQLVVQKNSAGQTTSSSGAG